MHIEPSDHHDRGARKIQTQGNNLTGISVVKGGCMLVRGPDPIETLPLSIRRPSLFKSGRWVAVPLADQGSGVVTRLEVAMWLPVGEDGGPDWDDVTSALGRSHSVGPLTLPRVALDALLPELDAPVTPQARDRVTVSGPVYPSRAFEGAGSTMARAVRLTGGLMVTLSTT